jgi:glycosyltransferase involved in cell wall biosynthesis
MLKVIVLTYNEEIHIQRCIESLRQLNAEIMVVDSYSTDKTKEICIKNKVQFFENPFVTHAQQFNWALSQLINYDGWVFRIDADEIITSNLANSINDTVLRPSQFSGYEIKRVIRFQGKLVRFGGVSNNVVRIFRFGKGKSEDKLMDEHILVEGKISRLCGQIIDDNKNNLEWWCAKHMKYAQREAQQQLESTVFSKNSKVLQLSKYSKFRRFLKNIFYTLLPIKFRALAYLFYRLFIRFGILDRGTAFDYHILQGFWYRYMVDLEILSKK